MTRPPRARIACRSRIARAVQAWRSLGGISASWVDGSASAVLGDASSTKCGYTGIGTQQVRSGSPHSIAEPTLATTDSDWGRPRTSAATKLDAKTPKCPTHGLLTNREFACNGRHRVAVLVEPGGMAYLVSGKSAYAPSALDAVAIQMGVDSRSVHAVGEDEFLDAGAADVVLDEKRKVVLSEPPSPLSGRLNFCFGPFTIRGSPEKFSQVRGPSKGVGVTSHYLHNVVEITTFPLLNGLIPCPVAGRP